VILINLSQQIQAIQPGDGIAQLIIHKVERIKWKEVKAIAETERNDGGFGHTGK
jgi:dUTP pyrophosphatase